MPGGIPGGGGLIPGGGGIPLPIIPGGGIPGGGIPPVRYNDTNTMIHVYKCLPNTVLLDKQLKLTL